jgi:hypothetical protein
MRINWVNSNLIDYNLVVGSLSAFSAKENTGGGPLVRGGRGAFTGSSVSSGHNALLLPQEGNQPPPSPAMSNLEFLTLWSIMHLIGCFIAQRLMRPLIVIEPKVPLKPAIPARKTGPD